MKNWIKSKEAFIDYVGTRYGGDGKASIKPKILTITSVDKPKKPTETEYDAWDSIDKDDFNMDNKDYRTAD